MTGLNPSSSQSYARQYSSSAPPRSRSAGSPFDWNYSNYESRRSQQRRQNPNQTEW